MAPTMSATEAVAFGAWPSFTRTTPPKSKSESCANLVITKRPANSGALRLRIRSLSLSIHASSTISASAGSSLIGQTSKLHHDKEEVIQPHRGTDPLCIIMSQMVGVGSVRQHLSKLIKESLKSTLTDESNLVPVIEIRETKFGDYECNNAMGIWSKIKGKTTEFKNLNSFGQAIMKNLAQSDLIEKISFAHTGHINIVLSNLWIEERIQKMLVDGIGTWAPVLPIKRVVVDFSSPNIAKELHVGHLRSTIIGDSLSRMLEFSKVEVLRRNHVGDWGTQFGMLIEYLFEEFPNCEELGELAIGDLQSFYKASKVKFDKDPAFKKRAQEAVVRLQGGEVKYRKVWQQICDISRNELDKIYKRLKIQLQEKGESFYSPYIPIVLRELEDKGLMEISNGAKFIFVEGQKDPFIVVKHDGGFNYASTDMAALWYRLNEEKAQWIIYVTDVSQLEHFEPLFSAAKRAGWIPIDNGVPYPKASHVGFGFVLGNDGKRIRSSSSDAVRLVDLLDEAKNRSRQGLIDRGRENEWTAEELENAAEAIGYGAVKYADLKNNRLTNYTFNFDQMLDFRGNTAVYLLYAHARICSIIRKSGKDIDELKKTGSIQLKHDIERLLGLHLIQFSEIVEDACTDLLPNKLCDYLYKLSENFSKFYSTCKVVGSEEETSRLLLCESTAIVMRECFRLLGITPLYKL